MAIELAVHLITLVKELQRPLYVKQRSLPRREGIRALE